jgi:glycosyltransferase involved in cell wall biosynthesis
VGKRLGIPVVYEVRAFWEDAAVDHGTTTEGSLRYRVTRALETHALRQADHVFTICEGLRQDIVARGIPADKVTVIPNAVDIEKFDVGGEPDPALRAQLGPGGATVHRLHRFVLRLRRAGPAARCACPAAAAAHAERACCWSAAARRTPR